MDEDNRRPREGYGGVGLPRMTDEAGERAYGKDPVEERRQRGDEAEEGDTGSAQKLRDVYTKLQRISEKAKQEPTLQFTSLAHLLTVEMLEDAWRRLRKDASPGIDGVTAEAYEQDLERNLRDLHRRLREGRYRAQPVRRVYIEKENGKLRPLGIPALEDKIAQRAAVTILGAIYEQDFLSNSYGFRPGRGAQDALDAVFRAIAVDKVNYILEADITGYFDNIVRRLLMELVRKRVKDPAMLRLLSKWLHAGVSEEGRLLPSTQGTPQGAVISPWMANVYLHYVLDEWVMREVKPRLRGEVYLIRYADDFILGFEHLEDAERVAVVLRKRLAKYGLELNEEKTRLIAFGRHAELTLRRQGKGKPSTFDFLGFTHICAKARNGKFTVKLRTMRKRLRRALRAMSDWCRDHRHRSPSMQWPVIVAKLRGHYAYYGRRTNSPSLRQFFQATKRVWLHWLQRRAQHRTLKWPAFAEFLRRHPLPQPRVVHRGIF